MKDHARVNVRGLAALLFSMVLCGCGGGGSSPASETEARPAAVTTDGAADTEPPTFEERLAAAEERRSKMAASDRAPVDPGADAPVITFETVRHDFGKVDDTAELKFSFPFTNTGTGTLHVDQVKPSCGCTVARPLRTRAFEPGEGESIDVSFKPKGFGRQSKYITILSNASNEKSLRLYISADITPFVTVHPTRVQLNDAVFGRTNTAIISITADDPNLEVMSVKPAGNNRYLSGQVIGPDAVPAGVPDAAFRTAVEVTLDSSAPWGQFTGQLDINVRGRRPGDPKEVQHTFQVSIAARLFGAVVAQPALFSVAVVPPGESFEKTVRLTGRDGVPFAIRSAKVTNTSMPGVTVDVREAEGGYDLVLSGDSGDFMGRINGVVTVQTDVPGEPPYQLRFYGMVRDPDVKP